jgi:hypothetical protein
MLLGARSKQSGGERFKLAAAAPRGSGQSRNKAIERYSQVIVVGVNVVVGDNAATM